MYTVYIKGGPAVLSKHLCTRWKSVCANSKKQRMKGGKDREGREGEATQREEKLEVCVHSFRHMSESTSAHASVEVQ